MILQRTNIKKSLAAFFLLLWTTDILIPLRAWALTSGPTQPEHTQFQPASTSNMVDLFSGGLKYNIPLLDVDGYPVNLNYASGVGMDDEASWVGLGWNLNVGAINRQLRGLPDDFKGDSVVTEHNTAEKVTYGVKGTIRGELGGTDIARLSGSVSIGIFSDTYTGLGAEFGVNAGLSIGGRNGGLLTGNLNVGANSNTSSGVTVTSGLSLEANFLKQYNATASVGVSANLGYNSRQGFKELSLGGTFALEKLASSSEVTYTYNTPPFSPKINFGYKSTSHSYSLDLGPAAFLGFAGVGLTGYMSRQKVLSNLHTAFGFGYLYADKGTSQKLAVMDFMREKENPVIPNLPNLALAVLTPDVFAYSNQGGGGQFRLQRGNAAVVFDNYSEDVSSNSSLGGDYGGGAIFHGGVTIYNQDITNTSGKWTDGNDFLKVGDYKSDTTRPEEEQAYFKVVGETNVDDNGFVNKIKGENLVNVPLNWKGTFAQLKDKQGNKYTPAGALKKDGRQVRNTVVSYLTAGEMAPAINNNNALLNSYPLLDTTFKPQSFRQIPDQQLGRKSGYRKPHHISSFAVTEPDGKRAVYGLPVYSVSQDEYSFAIDKSYRDDSAKTKNLIRMDLDKSGNGIKRYNSIDSFYHHDHQSAYASSYLLTALQSPDYVDVTNDGITDDDLGTAVKFNYSKLRKNYRWRTPTSPGRALYNRALQADDDDDRGSVVYGEKEIWYLQSIETKTKIAYFITVDRDDALGVKDLSGAIDATNQQRCLKEIRLYSKSDLSTPIKTVVLDYDYSLCPNVPNSTQKGKLTLKGVYFKYASSKKGRFHPYKFEYGSNEEYAYLSTDRWGNFKSLTDNARGNLGEMRNDEFPYVIQDTAVANSNARKWNLSKIYLPTGGAISVDYEAGDYAYVQDRKAMQMTDIKDLVIDSIGTVTNDLTLAHGFKVKAPGPLRGNDDVEILRNFVTDYLNGRNDFYARLYVNLSDQPSSRSDEYFDLVPAYAEISKIRNNKDGTYNLIFKDVADGVTANPFAMAAWQRMRIDYPMYAYPGYKNRISGRSDVVSALNALLNAVKNLSELKVNFNERAMKKHFAGAVNLKKSFVRMVKADGHKIGGPARVKRIMMTDEWKTMTHANVTSAAYGQQYEYTMDENGKTISSGVASYEPYVGADENPMRMPVPYSQLSKGTLTNFFYLEEPFGESVFPAPQIGYRNVIERALDDSGNADALNLTGWLQHEFYTAKDYPVIVETQGRPDVTQNGPKGWANFVGGTQVYELIMSQGYLINLNDMHGKPKAERVFNRSGAEISSTSYYYKSDVLDAGKMKLNNTVSTIDEKGNIRAAEVIGREIELVTDMREQESKDFGNTIQIGLDVIPLTFITLPVPHWPAKSNDSYRLFRSASTVKTILQTGIVDRVVKMINGSSSTATNLVFDRYTGTPVVTSTTNVFNDPVYSVTLPAYWKYTGMAGAYKNVNTVINNFKTNASGVITGSATSLLAPGDELLNLNNGQRLWVINTPVSNVKSFRLINDGGGLVQNFTGNIKVVRSGYRNQTSNGTATVLCLSNPVAGNSLNVFKNGDASAYRVINASVQLFEEEWGAKRCDCQAEEEGSARRCDCPEGYVLSPDGKQCYLLPVKSSNNTLNLVTGPVDRGYGMYGFQYKPNTIKKSDFWGGDCLPITMHMLYRSSAVAFDSVKSGLSARRSEVAVSDNKGSCGRLNNCGVWLNDRDIYGPTDKWMRIETCVQVSSSGSYSLGYGVDNIGRIYIDGVLIDATGSSADPDHFAYWHVLPVTLSVGRHTLQIDAMNNGGSVASVGVEIYRATPQQLSTMPEANIPAITIFSTINLLTPGALYNLLILDQRGVIEQSRYSCNGSQANVCSPLMVCDSVPATAVFNPYLAGMLGNWRVSQEKALLTNRSDQQIFADKGAGLNLRNSGYLKGYQPYWYFNTISGGWDAAANNTQWVTSRYVTSYDKYGQEQENKDALQRYSSVLFGYNGAVATAVAGNAMKREVFYDGFEDYRFNNAWTVTNICRKDSFSIAAAIGDSYVSRLNTTDAHSGNYSLKLTSPITLTATAHNLQQQPGYGQYTAVDNLGRYVQRLTYGLYDQGFQPSPNKTYVFSAWVKDGTPGDSKPSLNIQANGVLLNWSVTAVVEGWKKIEGTITLAENDKRLQLYIPSASNILIDDIRIFPFDANIQTHAYDDKTLRLMATMDENNFATFYEYDDEGALIRVKKETDRGIMTIKETRSVFKKIN
ncbi:hypothetical protein ACDQ55_21170 [Chitinophaga sp. 30R24]|uniref:hypothetical protein n=1 Tax=Chitinophaga sp. 30R24 TaxID=3248838 RepID=UPI003B8F2A13